MGAGRPARRREPRHPGGPPRRGPQPGRGRGSRRRAGRPAPIPRRWRGVAGAPHHRLGVHGDKDVEGVIEAAARSRSLEGATVVCTAVDLPRAMPPEALAAAWRARLPTATVLTAPDPGTALRLALGRSSGPVVVAGSLYLVGAARARLVDDPALRDPDPA